jgi:hypothetical protein
MVQIGNEISHGMLWPDGKVWETKDWEAFCGLLKAGIITVLLTFGYRIAQPPEGGERSASNYGLLADFLDGMLEACSKQTKIVDAWEYSYPYKERSQFEEAYTTVKEKSVEWTARPEEYRRHVEAGFGIWMDCRWRQVFFPAGNPKTPYWHTRRMISLGPSEAIGSQDLPNR